jgi:hypothetical protein
MIEDYAQGVIAPLDNTRALFDSWLMRSAAACIRVEPPNLSVFLALLFWRPRSKEEKLHIPDSLAYSSKPYYEKRSPWVRKAWNQAMDIIRTQVSPQNFAKNTPHTLATLQLKNNYLVVSTRLQKDQRGDQGYCLSKIVSSQNKILRLPFPNIEKWIFWS